VRIKFDGADAYAAVTIDQHAIASMERDVAGQIVKQVAGLLKADRDYFGKFVSSLKWIGFDCQLIRPAPPVPPSSKAAPLATGNSPSLRLRLAP